MFMPMLPSSPRLSPASYCGHPSSTLRQRSPRGGGRGRASAASNLGAAVLMALGAACAPSAAEICHSLADKQAHCDYQVANDAVARCVSRLTQVPTACRTSMLALGQCVVDADCDMSEADCQPQIGRYHADCANPNAFGSDF